MRDFCEEIFCEENKGNKKEMKKMKKKKYAYQKHRIRRSRPCGLTSHPATRVLYES